MQSLFDLFVLPLWREKGNTANNDLSFPLRKRDLLWVLYNLPNIGRQPGQLGMGALPLVGCGSVSSYKGRKKGHGEYNEGHK